MMSRRSQSIPFLKKIAFLFFCSIIVFYGIQRISFNVDVLSQLPPDLKDARGLSRLQKYFGSQQGLIISIQSGGERVSADLGRDLASHLLSQKGLTGGVTWRNSLENSEALAELSAHTWLNGGEGEWKRLINRLSPGKSQQNLENSIEELTSGALGEETILLGYDPLGLSELLRSSAGDSDSFGGVFASRDETLRIIKVQPPVESFAGYRDLIDWVDQVRGETRQWRDSRKLDALEFGFTGEPAFVAEISGSMDHDMSRSGLFTALLVGILFWIFFRRLRAMLVLLSLLALVLLLTVSAGALLFGALTTMGAGFVAIVIGLTIDYGAVLLEGGEGSEGDSPGQLRQRLAPPILWAAFTTGLVFLSLRLSSFPGIVQFGTLVTLGVLIGAAVMILLFSPEAARSFVAPAETVSFLHHPLKRNISLSVSALGIAASGIILWTHGLPGFDPVFKPFQLKDSAAVDAMEEIQTAFAGEKGWMTCLMWHADDGNDRSLIKLRNEVQADLETKKRDGKILAYHFPDKLLPSAEAQRYAFQHMNRLLAFQYRLERELTEAGFADEPVQFLRLCFESWRKAEKARGKSALPLLPQTPAARDLLDQIYSRKGGEICLLGQVRYPDRQSAKAKPLHLGDNQNGFGPAAWEPLAIALQGEARGDLRRMIVPVLLLLSLSLLIIFRNFRDLMLCLVAMTLGGLLLMGILSILGIQVNAFAACAVPILLGTGLDYSIHMIFALRRGQGEVNRTTGIVKALQFCGLSSAIAFGSLSFSASEGLSNLGLVCGMGILLNMVVATCLLPGWWLFWKSPVLPGGREKN